MAAQAEAPLGVDQQFTLAGAMRIVTSTATAVGDGVMPGKGGRRQGPFLLVTPHTQLIAAGGQHPLFRAAVGFMAIEAGIGDDGVDILHRLQLFLVIVTSKTKVIPRREELIGDVAGMDIMAGLTIVHRRWMLDLLCRFGIMTLGAKGGATLGEQALLGGAMRGMATETISFFDRRVDRTLPLALAVVTSIAEGRDRRLQQPLHLRAVRRMTSRAIALGHWRMDDGEGFPFPVFALVVVTLFAKGGTGSIGQLRRFAGVGVVTAETVTIRHRRMNDLGLFADESVMTLIAKGATAGHEEFGIVASVRHMASGAAFVVNDRMDTLHPFGGIVVATGAQRTIGGDEEFTILTQVRIMTPGAAIFESRMDDLLPLAHAVMTLLTQGGPLGGESKCALLAGMGNPAGGVAGIAFATGERIVQLHPWCRCQRSVTFGGHATLSRSNGEGRHHEEADPE